MARYIDAETTENSLRQYAEQKHANGEIELANGILKAACNLKTIPIADVKVVVRGYWIRFSGDEFCCSSCGKVKHYDTLDGVDPDDFCPSCGADMREVE